MSLKRKRKKLLPGDAAEETASRVEGQRHARAFCVAHAEALIQLIATYSDDEAETALATLREAFWGSPGSFEHWNRQAEEYLRTALARDDEADSPRDLRPLPAEDE